MRLSEFLKEKIEAKGLSQLEIARLTEINPSCLNEIISGKRRLSAKHALLLACVLNSDAEEMLNIQTKDELKLVNTEVELNRIRHKIYSSEGTNELNEPEPVYGAPAYLYIRPALNPAQRMLLDFFSYNDSQEDVDDLRIAINHYYYKKLDTVLNELCDKGLLTEEKVEAMSKQLIKEREERRNARKNAEK